MTSEELPFFEDRHRALAAEVDRFVAEKIAPLADRDEDDVTGNAREYVARFVHPEAGDVNAFDAFIVPGNSTGLSAKPIALICPSRSR